jgi:DNA processing protein
MFPIRNRIIAGLSEATIVVEAPERSGALITANYAFSENRLVYAIPGEFDAYRQVGCHNLIKNQKAVLLDNSAQIIDDITPTQLKLEFSHGNESFTNLLVKLTNEPTHINTLAKSLNSTPESLISNLLELEMMEKVRNVGGMCYVRL